ncbi:DMT family transporter [Pedobacter sp.]|nr:DMT family transporter [Candidatus Saccharibacteria bacterium]
MILSRSKSSLSGGEALLGAAFLFAITNVLVREMAHMWGDQAQIAVRFALVWLILFVYARFKGEKASIPRSKMLPVIIYSVLAAISILFFTLSVQMTTIANTLFMSNATELVVAFLLGTLLLREKLSSKKLIAIGLSLAGLALYSGALLSGNAGLVFGLLAGATVGFCNLLAKQLKGVNLTAILRVQFGLGTILMIALTLFFSPNDIVRTVSVEGTAVTILFALVLIAATHLVLYGFQHFDVNIASVVLSSQLAIGALLGFFIYQEVPAPNEIISGVLIACAAVVGSMGYKSTAKDVQVHS